MYETMKALYDSFYTPLEMAELKQAVEVNRELLRDKLPVAERKLVLRIVDDLNMMATDLSMDSFICGIKLARQMANELNNYGNFCLKAFYCIFSGSKFYKWAKKDS